MLSVVIPTLNSEARLARCLSACVPAVMQGMLSEVIICDAGSTDLTLKIAEEMGVKVIMSSSPGRGLQLSLGAEKAKSDWLLFLHSDTILPEGWENIVETFIHKQKNKTVPKVGFFDLSFDSNKWQMKLLSLGVVWRCKLFSMPFGDQALLVESGLYQNTGGYRRDYPIMEDIEFVQRLKKNTILHSLGISVEVSSKRYEDGGVWRRWRITTIAILMYYCRVSIDKIRRFYEKK